MQEQLYFKDVPFLREHFGELRVCYMKGRGNYLCRKKLYDLTDQPVLNGLEEINQFRIISDWEKTTETGDRTELADLPENSHLWPKLDARTDRCIGSQCQQFDRCFITEMRRRAAESDIIIVNHHLFCADLAIKAAKEHAPDAGVLPDAGIVVFDEAHELEDVATNYFGVTVSNLRVDELLRDVEHTLRRADVPITEVLPACGQAARTGRSSSSRCCRQARAASPSRTARSFWKKTATSISACRMRCMHLYTELQAIPNKPDEVHALSRRVEELRVNLGFILEAEQRNTVFWIERRGDRRGGRSAQHNVFLQATPITVSDILRTTLFEHLDSAVLTSATLAVAGGFEYIRNRIGIEHARELVVQSHFDYESQALLYVPPDLPDPREPQFVERASQRVKQLLEITRGRAFCLFTSYALMHQLHERLLGELEFPMLLQGSAPKNALLEEFRLTPNCVLFATSSFWQGVDVQGEQLSCVIIDRLPFAVPNDPVVAARIKAIDEEGGNAFFQYQVPSAALSLKQGFGRLIRSLHDRGLLCLLDNRILKKQYGRVFLDSLPKYGRTTDIKMVERFFGAGPAG